MPTAVPARLLAAGGVLTVLLGMLAVSALHVLPPTAQLSPVYATISEYAYYETGWVFNLGVLVLAAGSLAVLGALAYAKLVRPLSFAALGMLLWSAGLAAVVYFPKHDWTVGPSTSGHIHRVASLVAFVSLPIGALLVCTLAHRDPRWRANAWLTAVPALGALAMFSVIVGAVLIRPHGWWEVIPLGAVERALATAEVVTVLTLAHWAWRAAASPSSRAAAVAGRAAPQRSRARS